MVEGNIKNSIGVKPGLKDKFKEFNKNYFIFYLLVVEIVFLTFSQGAFLSVENIMNVLRQCSIIAIIAAGSFLVIVTGGIDLSAGSTVAFVGICTAKLIVDTQMNIWLGIGLGMVIGTIIGLINAVLVTKLMIPPFIVTLGTMEAIRGLTYIITNAYPVSNLPAGIELIGRGYIGPFPIPVLIMVVVFVFVYFLSEHTKAGRYIFAIGSNREAAYLSGIKVKLYQGLAYVLASVFAALSGVILLSRLSSGQPNAGIGYEFQAITAAVLGGTSTTGGKGKIIGVLLGALFIAIMNNGMTLLAVNSYYQQMLRGIILIAAIAFDVLKSRRNAKLNN
jgi:ribose transport system permease protein